MKNKVTQFFIAALLIAACSADRSNVFSIQGYNCGALKKIELEDQLREISGLAYDAGRKEFLAINDEQETVFVLQPETFRIKNKMHFGEKGDYEEIQFFNNYIYVLRSDGTVFNMKYDGADVSDIKKFPYQGSKAEFESFYISPQKNTLVLIPKNSKDAKISKVTTAYVIDAAAGTPVSEDNLKIQWQQLQHAVTLHPSAAAVRSGTKQIYMVASIEKVLLVLDTAGNIQAEYALPFSVFAQPEGIAFDSDQNLYISNEAVGVSPVIIKIPVQTK